MGAFYSKDEMRDDQVQQDVQQIGLDVDIQPRPPKIGDIICINDHKDHDRSPHWVLYVGNCEVIHICHKRRQIVQEKISCVLKGKTPKIANIRSKDGNKDSVVKNPQEIVERAHQSLGVEGIHLAKKWGSCRQFVVFCQVGDNDELYEIEPGFTTVPDLSDCQCY